MQTPIGRLRVITMATSSGGFVVWETVILVYPAASNPAWYQEIPEAEIMDRHLTEWEGWLAHAHIVGWLRVGYELQAGDPTPRVIPIGVPFQGSIRRALGTGAKREAPAVA